MTSLYHVIVPIKLLIHHSYHALYITGGRVVFKNVWWHYSLKRYLVDPGPWTSKIGAESGQELWLVDVVWQSLNCCLRMTDKRQTVTKVKCKSDKSTTKQSIFVDYSLEEALEVCFLSFAEELRTLSYSTKGTETRPNLHLQPRLPDKLF